ncbi:HD domain-containing protein [Longispora albida]|uniref:HD domain-containing protein n=1 Tax=Longispora albida TaxID=203523 RepID=UPI001FE034D0|nr:HD domain-containing protein [Longispora albida]
MSDFITEARELAETQLAAALPRRWTHVQAVAAKAAWVSTSLPAEDGAVLIAAAWLHDIGYGPNIAQTGFHPLDGGRWLRQRSVDDRVVRLVAHHSCAWCEAEERGLGVELASEFDREQSETADALWYCDMTTGPDGQDVGVKARLTEIRSRYGPDHVVTRFINRAEPELVGAVRRVEARLTDVGLGSLLVPVVDA